MLEDSFTISFLPDLDKASDTRKANLCRTWKNAVTNDYGCFVVNLHDFVAHEGKKVYPRVQIKCALVYPKVYYDFDIYTANSDKGSPIDLNSHNFDVHECAPNVMLMVEHHLRDYIKNYGIKDKLINSALEAMRKDITE